MSGSIPTINPLHLHIDSAKRVSGNNNSFMYKVDIPFPNDFTKACICDAVIPKSYYNVASPYNTFTLTELGLSATVTLQEGNYSMENFTPTSTTTVTNTNFMNYLAGALNVASANLGHGWVYSMTFPNQKLVPQTGKITFNVSGNSGQPTFTFATKSLYEQLGFGANTSNIFSGGLLTSSNVIYLQSESTLFLHSDIIQNYNDNIIQEIYVGPVAPFSSIIFSQSDFYMHSHKFTNKETNIYMFRLSDENDEDINLNGKTWNFTIVLF